MRENKNLTLDVMRKKCGVSIGTMHKYIHNPHLLKTSTRDKIKYIFQNNEELAFYNSEKKIRSIALFCKDSRLLMTHDIIIAIQKVCSSFPHPVNLILIDSKKEEELNIALNHNTHILSSVDAVIAFAYNVSESYEHHIRRHKIPIVCINSRRCECGISYDNNNYQGSIDAVQHLLHQGYSRIGFIGWDLNDPHLLDRYNGWKTVCEQNNIEHEYDFAPITPEGGYIAGKRLIDTFNPDSLFVACDAMALGTMNYINDTNLKIGSEIGVMGFDNIYSTSFIGLSTMHQLLNEKVTQMIQYITKFDMKDFDTQITKKISFTPVVVARKSTKKNITSDEQTWARSR